MSHYPNNNGIAQWQRGLIILCLICYTTACSSPRYGIRNNGYDEGLEVLPDSAELVAMQSRQITSGNSEQIVLAAADTLKEMGFNLELSDTQLGLVTARADHKLGSDINPILFIAVLLLAIALHGNHIDLPSSGGSSSSHDMKETLYATVTTQSGKQSGNSVRITLQHLVFDTKGRTTAYSMVDKKEAYDKFFELLNTRLNDLNPTASAG